MSGDIRLEYIIYLHNTYLIYILVKFLKEFCHFNLMYSLVSHMLFQYRLSLQLPLKLYTKTHISYISYINETKHKILLKWYTMFVTINN